MDTRLRYVQQAIAARERRHPGLHERREDSHSHCFAHSAPLARTNASADAYSAAYPIAIPVSP